MVGNPCHHFNERATKRGLAHAFEITDEMSGSTSDFEVSLILPDCQILLHRIDDQSVPTYMCLQHSATALA